MDFVLLIQNLFSNSIKYRKPNTELNISIYPIEKTAEHIIFVFEDNGIGFDQKYSSQIFNMFGRLNKGNENPGNGVGLAFCKKIVQTHNGNIWAESAPKVGSKIFIKLPF